MNINDMIMSSMMNANTQDNESQITTKDEVSKKKKHIKHKNRKNQE